MTVSSLYNQVAGAHSARVARLVGVARIVRARVRLISGLVLLSFVLCHLVSHIFLIVSLPVAEKVLGTLMKFWWTDTGTYVLATALAIHVLNALWSIYIRRYLRLPVWELAQLGLGLSIPPLLILHIVGTKISDHFLGTSNDYHSVLAVHWIVDAVGGPLANCRGADVVGARLHRSAFLATHQADGIRLGCPSSGRSAS